MTFFNIAPYAAEFKTVATGNFYTPVDFYGTVTVSSLVFYGFLLVVSWSGPW
jgi:hypothetical protein